MGLRSEEAVGVLGRCEGGLAAGMIRFWTGKIGWRVKEWVGNETAALPGHELFFTWSCGGARRGFRGCTGFDRDSGP